MRAFLAIAFSLFPAVTHAHVGHVGELAGHAHWVGVGAAVAAAALAALLAKTREKDGAKAREDIPAEEDAAPEGETAAARA